MKTPRRILISPLDWGLGHASRIIPLIDKHLELGDNVIIAGSGMSLNLLKKQFPHLQSIEIPSFTMRYSAGKSQVWAVAKAFPSLIYYSIKEHKALKRIVNEENIDFIISDNRFGLFHKTVSSAYITHQLLIKLPKGWTWLEPFVAFVHRYIINKFTECWVPDFEDSENALAGELSHPTKLPKNVKYIGALSRFNFSERSVGTHGSCVSNQILAILSGAEPQRTIFENELLTSLQNNPSENIILIKGKIEAEQKITKVGKVTVYNYMNTEQLQEYILKADKIICRSGYSSIMDLYALGKLKNATLIPTPGQTEQEYLAEYISNHIK
jgi:UDP:flavonoid glycosyltransferase YjiC (YdhE family)